MSVRKVKQNLTPAEMPVSKSYLVGGTSIITRIVNFFNCKFNFLNGDERVKQIWETVARAAKKDPVTFWCSVWAIIAGNAAIFLHLWLSLR